jgi:hypothetical protein
MPLLKKREYNKMKEQNDEVFIIDSNAFITPYNTFYSFEIAPSFWTNIEDRIISKNIVILDKVFDEIVAKEDKLNNWLQGIQGLEPIDHKNYGIIQNYGQVINHIQSCGLYTPVALHIWSQEQVADPWIVAAALTNQYTVISLEVPIHGLNVKKPSDKPKIPNICEQLNVKCRNLYYMMNKLAIKL